MEECIWGFLLYFFKWLKLFTKEQLTQLVEAQICTLASDRNILEFTEEEAATVKKSIEAAVGAYFKTQFNCGQLPEFGPIWEATEQVADMFFNQGYSRK